MNDFSNISAESDLRDLMTVTPDELIPMVDPDTLPQNEWQCLKGEYYADLDGPTGLWCVFHTDAAYGKAFASYSNVEEADAEANRLNGKA